MTLCFPLCPPLCRRCAQQFFMYLFGQLGIMGVLYLTGALLYAMRIPECLFPGKFDILVRAASSLRVVMPQGAPARVVLRVGLRMVLRVVLRVVFRALVFDCGLWP